MKMREQAVDPPKIGELVNTPDGLMTVCRFSESSNCGQPVVTAYRGAYERTFTLSHIERIAEPEAQVPERLRGGNKERSIAAAMAARTRATSTPMASAWGWLPLVPIRATPPSRNFALAAAAPAPGGRRCAQCGGPTYVGFFTVECLTDPCEAPREFEPDLQLGWTPRGNCESAEELWCDSVALPPHAESGEWIWCASGVVQSPMHGGLPTTVRAFHPLPEEAVRLWKKRARFLGDGA